MRKNALLVAFAAALLLIGAGCDTVVTLEKPSVTYEAINSGAELRLTWTAVTDAKEYEITTDDSVFTTTASPFDVKSTTGTIEVRAVNGSDKSDPFTLDLTAKLTASITVYGKSDTAASHPSGIGFNTDGTALAVSLTNQASQVEFVMDDVSFAPAMYLFGPTGYTPPVNTWGNAVQLSTTAFDSLTVAPASGNYDLYLQIAQNATYAAWLDHNDDGLIDATDHFAKLKIESINGAVVTVKLAYQKIGGLRWLM